MRSKAATLPGLSARDNDFECTTEYGDNGFECTTKYGVYVHTGAVITLV